MATDECEGLGLHSPCGRIVTTSDGLRRQHCLVVSALLACYLDQYGIERSSAQSKLCPNALNHRVVRRCRSVSGLVAASLVRESDHRGNRGPRHRLVVTTVLVGGEGLGLHSSCGRLVPTSFVGLRCQHCLVVTALLDECEGLRSLCLVVTALLDELLERGHEHGELGRLLLCCGNCGPVMLFCSKSDLVALCLGKCGLTACFLGLSVPRGSLIGNGLCLRGSRLLMLLRRLQCTCAAILLVLHAGKCGLMLQSP